MGCSGILIDPEDEYLLLYRWSIDKSGPRRYAVTYPYIGNGEHVKWYMHRIIMGYPHEDIDHINGDGLDNRRSNLRIGMQVNSQNRKRTSEGRHLPLGVTKVNKGINYMSRIIVKGESLYLGTFSSTGEASQAYIQKRREIGVPLGDA